MELNAAPCQSQTKVITHLTQNQSQMKSSEGKMTIWQRETREYPYSRLAWKHLPNAQNN